MTSSPTDNVGYQTRSLVRALAILDAFGPDRPTLSVKDLHELLAIPKPTVSRLANVLEQHGLLRGEGHAYQLGPKTFELGSVFAQQSGLPFAARPAMEALAQKSSQTSSLAVLSGHFVLYLIVVRPPRPIHHVTRAGSREYAHPTGLGKALLAALPPDEVDRALGDAPLVRMTPQTICDRRELHAELEQTRRRGYALDQEEFAIGLRCVATDVELPRLGRAAISVSGPAADYSSAGIKRFLKMLLEASAELDRAFAAMSQFPVTAPGTPRAYDPFANVGGADFAVAADGQ